MKLTVTILWIKIYFIKIIILYSNYAMYSLSNSKYYLQIPITTAI